MNHLVWAGLLPVSMAISCIIWLNLSSSVVILLVGSSSVHPCAVPIGFD